MKLRLKQKTHHPLTLKIVQYGSKKGNIKKYKTPRSCSNMVLEGFVDQVRHRQNDSFSLRAY